MWLPLRHLLAVAILPGTVTVAIPVWLTRRYDVAVALPTSWLGWALVILGACTAAVGLALFLTSVLRFGSEGRGTLAPWDPPRQLVVSGPYRYVRNPMISGVVLILTAEALVLRSISHAGWAVIFAAVNATYIPLWEEPRLAARFGRAYEEYRWHVPRLIPRLRPWRGSDRVVRDGDVDR